MFCGNCGAKMPDGAKFCGSCGKMSVDMGRGGEAATPAPPPVIHGEKPVAALAVPTSSADFFSDSKNLKRLSIAGCIAYAVLFFFPWFKVAGQEWLALLGFGGKDGFNLIDVALLELKLFNVANQFVDVETIGKSIGWQLIVFDGVLVASFYALGGTAWNLLNVAFAPDKKELKGALLAPIAFIIVYFIVKENLTSTVANATSYGALGSIAGNAYEQLIQLSAIPWVLAALGIINHILIRRYIDSLHLSEQQTDTAAASGS